MFYGAHKIVFPFKKAILINLLDHISGRNWIDFSIIPFFSKINPKQSQGPSKSATMIVCGHDKTQADY